MQPLLETATYDSENSKHAYYEESLPLQITYLDKLLYLNFEPYSFEISFLFYLIICSRIVINMFIRCCDLSFALPLGGYC